MVQTISEIVKQIEADPLGSELRINNPPKIFTIHDGDSYTQWTEGLRERIIEMAKMQVQGIIVIIPDLEFKSIKERIEIFLC